MSDLILNALSREQNQSKDSYVPESLSESKRLEEERASLQAELQKASMLEKRSKEELETEEHAWESEDSLAAAQRFFSSMALGWGDEMGLWTAAAAASVATGTPIKEVYSDMRQQYDAQQEQFKQRQPGAALAADIAGSIASPVNALRIPGMASRVGTAAATGARVAAEGAVYGAGEAGEGERLSGAGTGAISGLAGYGVLRAGTGIVGKGSDILTRRRIEGDLVDEAGNFIPITLAAKSPKGSEGFLHTLYRDVVGPSFGAKGIIKEQENVIVKPIEEVVEEHKIFTKGLQDTAKRRMGEVKDYFKDVESAINKKAKDLEALRKQETGDIIVPLQKKVEALRSGKAEEIAAKATDEFKQLMDTRRFDFRQRAFEEALPVGATSRDVARIAKIEDIGKRAREVDRLWRTKGYKMLTDRKYRFKAQEADKKLKQMILSDDYFKVNAVDSTPFVKMVEKIQDDIGFFKDKNGRVTGEVVGALRSRLGTVANSTVDPQMRRGYYAIQSTIDDMLKAQMPKAAREAFEKEAKRWKTNVILRETVESANSDPMKRGAFTEADWVKEAFQNNKYDRRYATGPLAREALSLEANLKGAEKSIAKIAANKAKKQAALIEKTIADHKRKLDSRIEKLTEENTLAKRRMRSDSSAAMDIAANTKAIEKAQLESTKLDSTLKELKQLRSPENPSWFHSLAAHAVLGGLVGGPAGAVAAPAAGAAIGRALATPSIQKTLAGQTNVQQSINRMINSDASGVTADILSRALGRPLGGMLTGEQ